MILISLAAGASHPPSHRECLGKRCFLLWSEQRSCDLPAAVFGVFRVGDSWHVLQSPKFKEIYNICVCVFILYFDYVV